ncbi:dTDP-4-dehydrorhamnose 3,5-epimerase [Candidatus Kaiserbacteria bacterium RIFCSPHIGHO2_01_FULL_46_22]|uniref:dTDP-4-dehydrorhamnose 3,5-epimerase n=1 Tax=Candidatus Kaiserbacteria bacterium RIFCSPHIGHO2_01_FULL_46_22 TaxID=1798475 RepID=A0A1F6BXG6_9BACT|nr:MAG: dTDP-4-dehydrorhamnose 3,5-epimerase [Candidatus Kaiserbacteria bacterium RIFCSPHIGHO2_01_FULL_46_22]
MKFTELSLPGVYVIDIQPHADSRGWFARTWDEGEFAAQGLVAQLSQCSISFNAKRGTIRGMHFQEAPHEETKIVSCLAGSILDVVIDLRKTSDAYGKHIAVELSVNTHTMLYIPRGCAHGFQTLEDDTTVQYQISDPYVPQAARGIRWNDEAFGIQWPLPVSVISERDNTYSNFYDNR